MLSYVIKRVLIMIPTFVGVSFFIWLVMTLAPGRPVSGSGGGAQADPTENLGNLGEQNVNERMFREQFGLNRPRFWNNWTDLTADDLREALTIQTEGRKVHGIGAVGDARESLEDYGAYAVPPLMELLSSSEGEFQTYVAYWLRQSAYLYPIVRAKGHQRTDAETAEDKRRQRQNVRLNAEDMRWTADATSEERAPVIARWQTWYEEEKSAGRFPWLDGGWDSWKRTLTDTQFGKYWGNLIRFDFGKSFKGKEPVRELILSKLKYSLSLAVPSFIIAWILAVLLGVNSAVNHNKWQDQSTALILFMLYSVPSFLMATVLQRGLAQEAKWFPVDRFESVGAENLNTWEHFKDILVHLTLPLIAYTYGSLAYISRQARSGMLQVMQSDFVRTARAKGVKERNVIWRHAVRNGIMPLITLLGTALPVLLGGSVVIESVFNIPGFGKAMLDAIISKDYNVVMGIALISSVLTLVGLLIADILYAAVDPRVSFE